MKTLIKIAIISVLILNLNSVYSQTMNWAGLKEEKNNILNINVGLEDGAIYGVGYGYHIKTSLFPIVANVEFSVPSGDELFDDFKTKIGGQIRWIEFHKFQFSTRIQGVFRRYENDFVRMINFGSDMSATFGYYSPKWFIAAEFGFDKAVATQIKHSKLMIENVPTVQNGWYVPTGGNFFYGVQSGYTFNSSDINIKIGMMVSQGLKTKPTLPYYTELGYNWKF